MNTVLIQWDCFMASDEVLRECEVACTVVQRIQIVPFVSRERPSCLIIFHRINSYNLRISSEKKRISYLFGFLLWDRDLKQMQNIG